MTVGWASFGTYCILILIDYAIGLRVSEREELKGLDKAMHGESIVAKSVVVRDGGQIPDSPNYHADLGQSSDFVEFKALTSINKTTNQANSSVDDDDDIAMTSNQL